MEGRVFGQSTVTHTLRTHSHVSFSLTFYQVGVALAAEEDDWLFWQKPVAVRLVGMETG